jgi:hypothetical protein
MKIVFGGLALVALVSAAGDYVWYEIGVEHRMSAGIIHGAILLAAVGAVIGAAAGRLLAGLPLGAIAGVAGALVYYGIVSSTGRGSGIVAMVIGWAVVWLVLAILDGRFLRSAAPRGWPEIVVRGLLAAALGGVSFYLMVDTLWGRPPAGGRNYLIQFGAWLIAWAPGILALVLGGSSKLTAPRPLR